MHVLNIKIPYEGQKNAVIQVSGSIKADITEARKLFMLEELTPVPKAIRIESLVFALQEKMGCILWWKCKEDIYPILPVEGKGQLSFGDMQGLHAPSDMEGIYITTFGCDKLKYMLLTLDVTKQ